MSQVVVAVVIMTGLGVLFSSILAVAYVFLRVPEDPRVGVVEGLLPGTNCGACGQPGCAAFAETLVSGSAAPSGCTVSSPSGIEAIAEFLGVDPGTAQKRSARVHCAGGSAVARQNAAYEGVDSCAAAALVSAGGKSCPWGCLGLADCVASCGFDAIHMNEQNLPVIDPDKCTACGDCVDACPRDLIEILPVDEPLIVQCNAPLTGDEAMAHCAVACDACGRCAADAPDGLIEMVNGLPRIHYGSGISHSPVPTLRCPTGAIQHVTGPQYVADNATEPRRKHALHR